MGVFCSLVSEDNRGINPHISPSDAKIAQDFFCLRVPATESIAVAMVEEARARRRKKDQRDKSAGQPICTAIAARRVVSRDGRNERIKRSVSCRKSVNTVITYWQQECFR